MIDNIYLRDLLAKVVIHKNNILNQKGKSDIEPDNYVEEVDYCYNQIIEIILSKVPLDHVKTLNIYYDSQHEIKEIEYSYFEEYELQTEFAINIYWI